MAAAAAAAVAAKAAVFAAAWRAGAWVGRLVAEGTMGVGGVWVRTCVGATLGRVVGALVRVLADRLGMGVRVSCSPDTFASLMIAGRLVAVGGTVALACSAPQAERATPRTSRAEGRRRRFNMVDSARRTAGKRSLVLIDGGSW